MGGNAGQPDGAEDREQLARRENESSNGDVALRIRRSWRERAEYDRRLKILTQVRAEFMKAFPDDVMFHRSRN